MFLLWFHFKRSVITYRSDDDTTPRLYVPNRIGNYRMIVHFNTWHVPFMYMSYMGKTPKRKSTNLDPVASARQRIRTLGIKPLKVSH